ncbi:polynucleotide adenylyltransferase [Puccinia graminis f. sp. tritici]|uniref:Poly(A) polymerase n=1 Tax=Puccinia graminis f. sp. tritici TaxID=56615 RepID=A0A5B0S7N2_PUCGR|nr:polynucleotide adenylyltransferase [Puccinia graminis f. sp. tritici]
MNSMSPSNGSTPSRTYGVTGAISLQPATKPEQQLTVSLMEELKRRNIFESPEEARAREIVLGRLDVLVKQFVINVSISLGMSEAVARDSGGKIFTFGSYRLGVHGPGADIDTLCVVPRHITREHFFEVLPAMLNDRPEVTELATVPEAFVPIIKLKFSSIEVDLLFARLALPSIPDSLELIDDALLKNLDDRCVRSLGGSRVTDEILRLVPDVTVFRDSLRAIKLWAKSRAVYSNVMGFCGGVAWAMCVARVCQLYPNKPAGTIVNRFFAVLSQWNWPSPVLLKPIGPGPPGDQRRIWNPKIYPQDRGHRMPIITPAYPCMCSTHNITKSTAQIMMTEFKRGLAVTDEIATGTKPWAALFDKHDFFTRYRYYLQITASSPNAEIQLKWAGTVEARLRQLVMKVEEVETVDLAHPFIKGFERESYYLTSDEVRAIQVGDVPPDVKGRTLADIEGKEGSGAVYTSSFFIGLLVQPKPAGHTGPRKLDISYPVGEFTRMVKQWEGYAEDSMGIIVRYIKGAQLPDYVFDGEQRPSASVPSSKAFKRTKTGKAKQATSSIEIIPGQPTPGPIDLTCTTPTGQPSHSQQLEGLPQQQEPQLQERTTTMKKARPSSGLNNDSVDRNHTAITPPLSEMKLANQEAESSSSSNHDRELSNNPQHDPSPNLTNVFASVQA